MMIKLYTLYDFYNINWTIFNIDDLIKKSSTILKKENLVKSCTILNIGNLNKRVNA